MNDVNGDENLEHFRECLAAIVLDKLNQQPRKVSKKRRSKIRKFSLGQTAASVAESDDGNENDPAQLSDFIEVATRLQLGAYYFSDLTSI